MENQVLLNEVKKVCAVKMNQMPKPSNDIMKNEQKQVNGTMDVLEQAEEKKKELMYPHEGMVVCETWVVQREREDDGG